MKKISFLLFLVSFTFYISAQYNGSGFYRLRNFKNSSDCMKIIHDSINAQVIVGSASTVGDGTAAMGRVGNYLDIDIKTAAKNTTYTDPGTVIYLQQSTSSGNTYTCDVIGQGVGLKYISYCAFVGTNAGAQLVTGLPAVITNIGNNLYTAHVTLDQMGINQTRFLGDTEGKLTIHSVSNNSASNAPDECKWYIEPIDLEDNYFAASPVEEFAMNGNYYTTLRTAFSYKVPSGNSLKVYKVTGLPSEPGELATLTPVESGEIILAGLPIVIESTSLSSEDNKLEPFYHKLNAPIVTSTAKANLSGFLIHGVSSSSVTISGLNNSDVLYSNYGHHGHDAYTNSEHTSGYGSGLKPGWWPTGDNIGFFKSPYYDSQGKKWVNTYYKTSTIYRLGIKGGAVGFWYEVGKTDEVSGNEAYSPKQCQLFPAMKDLAYIAENGAEDVTYDVTEVEDHYLYVAKVVGNTLYAKDYGKFRDPDEKPDGAIDGMSRFYDYSESYDQSNWVALTVPANSSAYEKKYIHVKKGKLLNRVNPEMRVSNDDIEIKGSSTNWVPNSYCPASFMGNQVGADGKTYFFVKPKPQEVVHIVGAIYGGDNKFYIIAPDNYYNTVELKGGFVIDRLLMPSGSDFDEGIAYEFDAVVKKAEQKSSTLGSGHVYEPYTEGGVSNEYVVYPFSNPIVTGVQSLENTGKVVGVKYYNAMGVESDVPFKGVNIVVTTYDNGSRTTSKILK